MPRTDNTPFPRSPWPRRLSGAAALVLVPLFLFGGSVTTLGAGLAVDGWWNAEGHFMPFFPVEKWFRDLDTFVEHSHREAGLVLGLLMLGACAATWLADERRSARALVAGATLAIGFQGWLGGSRVLEASPRLAFLHATFAQAVFALMAALLVHQSPRWRAARGAPLPRGPGGSSLRRASAAATLAVYAEVALGAWYRHGLRTGLQTDPRLALGLHLLGALAVFALLMVLAARLSAAGRGDASARPGAAPFASLRRRLIALLWVQLGLGLFAFALRGESPAGGSVSFAEWACSTLHVLVGALLLAHCVAAWMWSWNGAGEPSRSAPAAGGAG